MSEKRENIRNSHFDPMSSEEWNHLVRNNAFSSEELCWIYCCGLVWRDLLTDPENMPSITKAFLDCGMNPNQLVLEEGGDEGQEDKWYDIPMIAATRIRDDAAGVESLKLLLEHGGDPNSLHEFGGFSENVFEFYVEDEYVHGPDLDGGSFYGLLLCWAYGGKQQSGYEPFTMLIDEPISIFKEYNRYWYEYEESEDFSSTLFVIEKETGRRVARYD